MITDFPAVYDPDGDGLTSQREQWINVNFAQLGYAGTFPLGSSVWDSDGDLLADGYEANFGTDPTTSNKTGGVYSDTDGDGIDDFDEQIYGTNPGNIDSDNDGTPDGDEVANGTDPTDSTDGARLVDADRDGIPDGQEGQHGTDPNNPDSDGDGTSDGDEVADNYNPADPGDFPGDADGPSLPEEPPHYTRAKLTLEVGDPSGSNSERWRLQVGDIGYVSPDFGEVGSRDFDTFQRGKIYQATVNHVASNVSPPDYDWHAVISGEAGVTGWSEGTVTVYNKDKSKDSTGPLVIYDQDKNASFSLLQPGEYHGDNTNLCSGKKAYVILPYARLHGKGGKTDPIPSHMVCLRKRSGTVLEPVIRIISGGDAAASGKSVSLFGTVDVNNTWQLEAVANPYSGDKTPVDEYQFRWSGAASGTGKTATVTPGIGRHVVVLQVFYRDKEVGRAEIHHLTVQSRTDQAYPTLPSAVAEPERVGVPARLSHDIEKSKPPKPFIMDLRVGATAGRGRVSLDGYPQNEYWGGAGDEDLPQALFMENGTSSNLYLQGYDTPSATVGDVAIGVSGGWVATNEGSQGSGSSTPETWSLFDEGRITSLRLNSIADVSGDHELEDIPDNRSGPRRPFRFWLNDDHDVPTTPDTDPIFSDRHAQYDLEVGVNGAQRDSADDVISCRRDTEDVAPLRLMWIHRALAGGLTGATVEVRWKSPEVYKPELKLPQRGSAPRIRVFRNADAEGKVGYLCDYRNTSLRQSAEYEASTKWSRGLAAVTGDSWTSLGTVGDLRSPGSSTSPSNPSGSSSSPGSAAEPLILPLAFEAIDPGSGWLQVRIRRASGDVIGMDQVYLHLTPIEEWCGVASVIPDGDPEFTAGRGAIPVPPSIRRDFSSWYREISEAQTLVFVHGYNMSPTDKWIFGQSAFKRLWWNGYRGRFMQFEWPSTYDLGTDLSEMKASLGEPWITPLFTPSFNGYAGSEVQAHRSGRHLAALLNTMIGDNAMYGDVHVCAHSQGNIVVLNALKWVPPGSVSSYVAMQAAVQSELYGKPEEVMSTPRWIASFEGAKPPIDNRLEIEPDFTWFNGWFWNPANIVKYGVAELTSPGAHGLDSPNLGEGYYNRAVQGAARRVNFYNPNDWALGDYIFEWCGVSKPHLKISETGAPMRQYLYLRQRPATSGPWGAPDGDTAKYKRLALVDFNHQMLNWRLDTYPRYPATPAGDELVNNYQRWIRGAEPLPWMSRDDAADATQSARLFTEFGSVAYGDYEQSPAQQIRRPDMDNGGEDWRVDTLVTGPVVQASEEDRQYQALAYIIEPRRRAQGKVRMQPVAFQENINIRDQLWSNYADLRDDRIATNERNGTEPTDGRYCHHRWHSGQFTGTIVEQSVFWREVIKKSVTDAKAKKALPVKPLAEGTP